MGTQMVYIKDLREQISIRDVLSQFNAIEGLKGEGIQLTGCCPLPGHGGDRNNQTAFSVNTQRNVWNCSSHCGGGNQFELFALFTGVDVRGDHNRGNVREAAVAMQTTFNTSPLERTEPAPKKQRVSSDETPNDLDRQPQTNEVLKLKLTLDGNDPFLRDKGLSQETISTFETGKCSRGMMAGRICVPIHNVSGERIAYAGRALKQDVIKAQGKWRFPKGFHKGIELFNQHRLGVRVDHLVVVEGFWPTMRLHALGFPCVSLMGSDMSDTQLERVVSLSDHVLLFLDNDEAGRKGTEKLMSRLSQKVFVGSVAYPDDRTEPEAYSDEELTEMIVGRVSKPSDPDQEGSHSDSDEKGNV